jgi:hypothetical protein
MSLFTNPEKMVHSDVRLVFADGTTVYAHKVILASAFDFFKELFNVPDTDVVQMQSCPEFVTAARVCMLLSWLYDDRLMPQVLEVRDLCPGEWYALEQIIDYMKPLVPWREIFNPSCKSCQRKSIVKHRRLCEECWYTTGDVTGRPVEERDGQLVPQAYIRNEPAWRLGTRPLTYDQVWQEGRAPTPDPLVHALCHALRASQSKTCAVFKQLVTQHMPPELAHRLTYEQAKQLQEVLAAGNWCKLTELGVHNLMALPGEYQCRRPRTQHIHCYSGFMEDKGGSLKEALQWSSGIVLDRSCVLDRWERDLCDCH